MKLNFRCHYMSSIHSLGHARTKLPFKSLKKPEKIILLKHKKNNTIIRSYRQHCG